MLRFLLTALPTALAFDGFGDASEGLSLLQLQVNKTTSQRPSYTSVIPGDHPGPNPIVTKEECRQRALALGLTLGASEWGAGWDFEVTGASAAGFITKGCLAYRLCSKGSFASDHLFWHAFYTTTNPGEDVSPEDAAEPVAWQYKEQHQRIDVPLHIYVDPGVGRCPPEQNKLPTPPAAPPVAEPPMGTDDEGAAVGDPHISHAGRHFDLDESDVHH